MSESLQPPFNPTIAPLGHVAVERDESQVSPLVVPLFVAAEEKVNQLWRAQDDYLGEAEQLIEALPEDESQRFTAIQEKYDKAAEDDPDGSSKPTLTVIATEAFGEDSPITRAVAAADAMDADIKAAEAQREQYVPEKTDALWQKAKSLEVAADYDGIVSRLDQYLIGPELWQASFVIGVRRLLDSDTPLTYEELLSLERQLDSTEKKWQENGLLKDPDSVAPLDAAETARAELLLQDTTIEALEELFDDAHEIQLRYGRDANMRSRLMHMPQPILQGLRYIHGMSAKDRVELDDLFRQRKAYVNQQLRTALVGPVAARLAELPAFYFNPDWESDAYKAIAEEARGIDTEEVLGKLEIDGNLASLPFEITEKELKEFIAASIPPIAIRDVVRITFRDMTEEENKDDNTRGHNHHDSETETSEIVINTKEIHRSYARHLGEYTGDQSATPADMTKTDMLQTLAHEYGHSLHGVLPYAALRLWSAMATADPKRITNYVKHMDDTDHKNKFKEDFADAVKIFATQGHVLQLISPEREAALHKIYTDFMPDFLEGMFVRQLRNRQAANHIRAERGVSEEEMRAHYLRHERPESADHS